MTVEEPTWFKLKTRDSKEFEGMLESFVKEWGNPTVLVFIQSSESQYPIYKQICQQRGITSQSIKYRNASKINMSIAIGMLR